MHTLKMVHLDIKPLNIAYSQSFKKWVFLDFGFTEFIKENITQKTLVCYVGTYGYSSPQMKKTLNNNNYVNLYLNDIFGL